MSRRIEKIHFLIAPLVLGWTAFNIYSALSPSRDGEGPSIGPQKTRFLIDERKGKSKEA